MGKAHHGDAQRHMAHQHFEVGAQGLPAGICQKVPKAAESGCLLRQLIGKNGQVLPEQRQRLRVDREQGKAALSPDLRGDALGYFG